MGLFLRSVGKHSIHAHGSKTRFSYNITSYASVFFSESCIEKRMHDAYMHRQRTTLLFELGEDGGYCESK